MMFARQEGSGGWKKTHKTTGPSIAALFHSKRIRMLSSSQGRQKQEIHVVEVISV